ncbi:MAG TPA: DUF1464 family protein [Ktedonobacteraceae bacterium]|nr:DUF1464 family protein [Ktedonobacteraceae bacterium]
MVLNIGVDCSADGWKTCLMDHGRLLKFNSFTDSPTMLVYLQHICALYPEPTIAVTSDWNTCFAALHTLTERPLHEMKVNGENHLPNDRIQEILIAIGSLNLQSYSIPAVAYLDSIPAYRKLNRAHMGTAAQVSAITTILTRMREQEAAWSEMRFLYMEVGHATKSLVVVEDGCIINGIGTQGHSYRGNWLAMPEHAALVDEAFWESLTQDVAGLMAVHHFEDIVVREQSVSEEDVRRKDAVIERLGEQYQLYTFPGYESEEKGYDRAFDAALIAGGLASDGPAAEVVERLRIHEAFGNQFPNDAMPEYTPLHALTQGDL